MSDPLAGLFDDDASAQAPAVTAADIEKIKLELKAEFEERAKGFQRLVSERDNQLAAYRAELEELKTASLSDEEREQLEDQKKDQLIRELQGKLELTELGKTYGDELPFYERLIGAGTAKEQLEVLRELRAANAQAQSQEPATTEVDIPDTDPNRPMRSFFTNDTVLLPDGTPMNDALADRILGSVSGSMASVTQHRIRPSD